MTEEKPLEPVPEAKPSEINLADLMQVAKPLLEIWTQTENEKHARAIELQNREIELEYKQLEADGKQSRIVTYGFFLMAACFILIAVYLFITRRDSTAMNLIELVASVGGAGFGGWGYGIAKKRRGTEEE